MTASQCAAGFEFGSRCDVGQKRRGKTNQDAIQLVLPPKGVDFHPLLIIADGMGGYNGGEIASKLTVETIRDAYLRDLPVRNYLDALKGYVIEAHQTVCAYAVGKPKLIGMGTTVVLALLTTEDIYVVSVGDSRVYLLQRDGVIHLSQDQSWVAEQMRAGLLTPEQARRHPKKNRLTMSISAKRPDVLSYCTSAALGADDIIVLCSDGLWGVVPDTLIQAVAFELPPQVAAEKLIDLANAGQGPDNISVIIARREGARLQNVFGCEDGETIP